MATGETRDESGRWLPGVSGNPNGTAQTWQPYGVRIQKWMDKPASEIKAIISDMDRLEALSSIDVICIKHVTKMMFGKDALKALQIALERIEGAPKQTIKIGGDGGDAIKVADATTAVYGMLGELAARKQSGGGEEDSVAQGGEAAADNASG